MEHDIEKIRQLLLKAKHPEDFFGKDSSVINKSTYRQYISLLHPDKFGGINDAFKTFKELYERGLAKIAAGKYGKLFDEFEVRSTKNKYNITSLISDGDISKVYFSSSGHAVKISSYHDFNGHLKREYDLMCEIRPPSSDPAVDGSILKLFTHPIESFPVKTPKGLFQVNVFEDASKERVRLDQILEYYPHGLDFRDAAWMFKRFLMILGYIHNKGIIHGSVIPEHLYVHPIEHGAKLVDWCWATKNQPLEAITPHREDFYPPEVFKKLPSTASSDIYMAAKCAFYLLNKDQAPPKVIGFLKSCMIGNPARRPQNAWSVHDEFKNLMFSLVGKSEYRELKIPT